MKKSYLLVCLALTVSTILSGCTDAEIASYAAQNNIPLTPQLINSIKDSANNNNVSSNDKNNGNNGNNGNHYGNNKGNGNGNGNNSNSNSNNASVTIKQGNDSVTVSLDAAISAIQGVAGAKGEKGDKGDTGAQGEQGERGEQGEAGRGIAHMQIDANGHLIAYYTDGTTEDCGLVKGEKGESAPTPEIPAHEKVGYILKISPAFNWSGTTWRYVFGPVEYEIRNVSVELIEINNNNPSRKYRYRWRMNYIITNVPSAMHAIGVQLDNSRIIEDEKNEGIGEYTLEKDDIYSAVPYVQISDSLHDGIY